MNRRISDLNAVIDHLKSRVDIVKVMGKEIDLEQTSSDLHKSLCCFHEEKTPSMTITPSKGLYHCFGCKASGDIITFHKQYYNISTVEAVRSLASEYNIDISRWERDLTEDEKRLMHLQAINIKVMNLMHGQATEEDTRGWQYLTEERNLTQETIDVFNVGYSPDISYVYAATDGENDNDIHDLELDRGQQWDDAIVYPLFDPYGKPIGFKNRPYWHGISVDQQGRKLPKFIGTSSKSPLHSDNHIYGLHIARKAMIDGKLIGVEGQHDVLKAHQSGIKNIIGTDGTALNKEKINQLEEFGVRELIIVYDGDNAGHEASLKVAQATAEFDSTVSIKIATLPNGYDPDEYLEAKGRIAFLKVVHDAVYASQYLIDTIAGTINIGTVTGKIDFIKRVQPVILASPIFEQSFLIAYIAEKIEIDADVIEDMMRAEQAKKAKSLLYNIDGERIVLGGILRDENFRIDTMLEMKKDDWYLPKHKMIYEMVVDMEQANVPISIETLKATMNNKGYNQLLNEGAVLDDIYTTLGDYRTIKEDIIDKSIRRKLIVEADSMKQGAQNLSNRLILVVEEHMEKVQKATDSSINEGTIDGKRGATDFMNMLHDRMANPDKVSGINLGENWKGVTNVLNGINTKKLITIAANQSVGKTTLLANWLEEISIQQHLPWLHFSLEMPSEEVVQKIIGIRSNVDNTHIQRGNIADEEYRAVRQATIDYHESPLHIDDETRTLEGIINKTRKYIRSHGIVGVSIDYIQLMSVERSKNKQRYEELGDISGGLKTDLANMLGIPVIVLSQLAKSALDSAIAKAEHGAGSYKIAQDSDIYITLKEKNEEEIEQWGIEKGNIVMNIDKNRGGVGDVLLDILFQRNVQRMMEVNG